MDVIEQQRAVCRAHGAEFVPVAAWEKLGIAREAHAGVEPLHGLRHVPEGGTCGWYVWAGEFSEAGDFFEPLHVQHLDERCPDVLPYLGLAPGWRFLIAGEYADVWYDPALLAE